MAIITLQPYLWGRCSDGGYAGLPLLRTLEAQNRPAGTHLLYCRLLIAHYGRAGQRILGDFMSEFKGIIRQVDKLGRVVIPKEIRKQLNLQEGENHLEMLLDNNGNLILRKYQPYCVFCGGTSYLIPYKEKLVCKSCIDSLNQADT